MKLLAAISLSVATVISAGCTTVEPQHSHSAEHTAPSSKASEKPVFPKKFAHKNYR